MSISKYISGLPDTKQGLSVSNIKRALISGIFIHTKDFTFPNLAAFTDIEYYYNAMISGDLIPLHGVKKFTPKDDEAVYPNSLQDFSYQQYKGKYRHILEYDWTIDYHLLVDTLTNTDYYVIYHDLNKNIYGCKQSDGKYRGLKTNRLALEKLPFQVGTTPSFSSLDIELKDHAELTTIENVSWMPSDVDRLFMTLTVNTVTNDEINFTAVDINGNVTTITGSDITLTDDINGNLSFTTLNLSGGSYKLSGITPNITSCKMVIKSVINIGCVSFHVNYTVFVANNMIFGDGNNMVFGNGGNMVFGN